MKKDDMVLLKTLKGEAIGIGSCSRTSDAIFKAKSGIVAITQRVFMDRGRYPAMWKKRSTD
jgi:H/ACA ribonucleoprotein complex subunit 4